MVNENVVYIFCISRLGYILPHVCVDLIYFKVLLSCMGVRFFVLHDSQRERIYSFVTVGNKKRAKAKITARPGGHVSPSQNLLFLST